MLIIHTFELASLKNLPEKVVKAFDELLTKTDWGLPKNVKTLSDFENFVKKRNDYGILKPYIKWIVMVIYRMAFSPYMN